jgi:hypothetical protein
MSPRLLLLNAISKHEKAEIVNAMVIEPERPPTCPCELLKWIERVNLITEAIENSVLHSAVGCSVNFRA